MIIYILSILSLGFKEENVHPLLGWVWDLKHLQFVVKYIRNGDCKYLLLSAKPPNNFMIRYKSIIDYK